MVNEKKQYAIIVLFFEDKTLKQIADRLKLKKKDVHEYLESIRLDRVKMTNLKKLGYTAEKYINDKHPELVQVMLKSKAPQVVEEQPKRKVGRWSKAEVEILIELVNEKASVEYMAEVLGRTEISVRTKLGDVRAKGRIK